MRHASVILLFVFLTAHALTAQSDGQLVRISSGRHDLRRATGDIVWATEDSLAIRVHRLRAERDGLEVRTDTVAVPRSEIDRLEISAGRHRQTALGATIGFSVGAAAGFVFGILSYKECVPQGIGMNCLVEPVTVANSAVSGAAAFGLAGAGVGAVIGSLFHSQRWENVAVNVVPARDQGLRLAVSFRTH
jgi:hypothetical protein